MLACLPSTPSQDPKFPPSSSEQSQQRWAALAGALTPRREGVGRGGGQMVERSKGWGCGKRKAPEVLFSSWGVALQGTPKAHHWSHCMVLGGSAIPAPLSPTWGNMVVGGREIYHLDLKLKTNFEGGDWPSFPSILQSSTEDLIFPG